MKLTVFLFILILCCLQKSYGKKLILEDFIYEESIKSVQLFQKTGEYDEQVTFPVASLEFSNILHLEFDELKSYTQSYYYKVIHCNGDWTRSNLIESEYLESFMNDNLITTYSMSFNTKVKYAHYSFRLPKVNISGNYVVAVYRDGNQEDLVLTRRFMIYSNKVTIVPLLKSSQSVEERFTHQQIDFGINYNGYPNLFIPQDEIKVVIRQNGRWDNAITNLKPLYVKDGEKYMDYSFFNLENNFPGGNEFRQFDCRKIRTNGININYIDLNGSENNVYVMQDKSRNGKSYALYYDANGRYIIGNNEIGGNFTDPDYVQVNFDFKSDEMPSGSIYIVGGFNEFKLDDKYKLNYNVDSDSYNCKVLLKQGYYNYLYAVKPYKASSRDERELEGSFFQTENFYEIIVYHKPIGERSDFIIGYYKVKYNSPN